MKLVITCLRKKGNCRSYTNASPEEHMCMAITIWCDAVKRLSEKRGISPQEAADKVNNTLRKLDKRSDNHDRE